MDPIMGKLSSSLVMPWVHFLDTKTWAEQTKRAHGFKLPLMPLPPLQLGWLQRLLMRDGYTLRRGKVTSRGRLVVYRIHVWFICPHEWWIGGFFYGECRYIYLTRIPRVIYKVFFTSQGFLPSTEGNTFVNSGIFFLLVPDDVGARLQKTHLSLQKKS